MGFTAINLRDFVNVPINEVGVFNMTKASQTLASFTSFNMDTKVFQNAVGRYWTGIISGGFSAAPTGAWTVNLTDTGAAINLKNGTWSGGTWSAVVDTATSNIGALGTIVGQAGGTYKDDGTLEGVAAGTANP